MSVLAASLHGRILRAFVLIVVLAVVLAVGVGYYVTQRQMDGFVAQLIAVEAGNVARSLSRAYGSAGGWATVDQVLADAGYRYAEEEEGTRGPQRTRRARLRDVPRRARQDRRRRRRPAKRSTTTCPGYDRERRRRSWAESASP